jgi:hypothetical protein
MKIFLGLILLLVISADAFAGVAAYSGESGEKLFIESAFSIGKRTYLIKFEGPESKWAGKVIETKLEPGGNSERYSFDYDLVLSNGTHKRTYQIIVENGTALVKGSAVKRVQLFFPENQGEKPMTLTHDKELTEASQKINLISEHKKSPFKPEVD